MKVFKKEPAVILGLLASIITAVAQAVPAGSHVTWSAIVPIIAAAVIRQFVYAPATVEQHTAS